MDRDAELQVLSWGCSQQSAQFEPRPALTCAAKQRQYFARKPQHWWLIQRKGSQYGHRYWDTGKQRPFRKAWIRGSLLASTTAEPERSSVPRCHGARSGGSTGRAGWQGTLQTYPLNGVCVSACWGKWCTGHTSKITWRCIQLSEK